MKTVGEIIEEYLEENGFDGLYVPGECACLKDDLFPCSETPVDCKPGYRKEDPTGEWDYLIGPKEE